METHASQGGPGEGAGTPHNVIRPLKPGQIHPVARGNHAGGWSSANAPGGPSRMALVRAWKPAPMDSPGS